MEKSVFANVIKLKVSKLDYPGLSGSALNLTSVLVTEEKDRHVEEGCEDRGRDWGDAPTN